MGVGPFFWKEWYQFRRNAAVFVVLLILLPGLAAAGTLAFQHEIPQDIPIGVAPEDDSVSEEAMLPIQAGTAMYASPERYDSPEAAEQALVREDVYLVIVVPPDITEPDTAVNVTLQSDDRLPTFREPANYTAGQLDTELNRYFDSQVTVDHHRIGTELSLSEFLVPTALVVILVLFSFVHLPFELYRERDVFDRVELTARIETAVAAKVAFHGLLVLVPLVVFQVVSLALGYRVSHFNPATVGLLAVTYCYMVATSSTVMFLTGLKRLGLFVNLGIMSFVLAFSSFIYPVGFFSSIRKTIATVLPTYHSMAMIRSTMTKEVSIWLFSPRVWLLVAFTVATLGLLHLSIDHYRRSEDR